MKNKKTVLEILICVAVIAATAVYMLKGDGLGTFLSAVSQLGVGAASGMLLLLLAYILLESVIIKVILDALDQKVTMVQCVRYSFIGFFFYCITPAGSGEQPMQLVAMRRDGLSTPKCLYALTLITITFKLSICVTALFVMLVWPGEVMELVGPIMPYCMVGLVLSVGCILLFAGLLWVPSAVEKLGRQAIRLLAAIRLAKRPEKLNARLDSFMVRYEGALKTGRRSKGLITKVLAITIVQRACLFAITAAAGLALGHHAVSTVDLTLSQAMVQLATEMLPLPGGTGLNELLFMNVFKYAFGGDTLAVLMISRGMSFYAQIAICGAVSLVFAGLGRLKTKKRI